MFINNQINIIQKIIFMVNDVNQILFWILYEIIGLFKEIIWLPKKISYVIT